MGVANRGGRATGALLGVFAVTAAAGAGPPPVPHGGVLAVFAADGNERITGDCTLKRRDVLSCDFLDVRLLPPNRAAAAEQYRQATAAVAQVSKADLDEARHDGMGLPVDIVRQLKRRMMSAGVRAGPKTREYLTRMSRAYGPAFQRGDAAALTQLAQLERDHSRRTCRLSAFNFKLDFKPLGAEKWISIQGPAGVCGVTKVYVLEPAHPGDNDLWQLSETLVALGKTTGPGCKDIAETTKLNERTVWGPGPVTFGGFELPCDFVE